MENNNFKQSQRQAFARLITEARKREAEHIKSASRHDDDDDIVSAVLEKHVQEHGASSLVANVRALHKKVEEAEEALGKLGIECEGNELRVQWGAPKELRAAVEDAKRTTQKEREAPLKKYDQAILEVWASESAQEARKIVEEVL